ncbi:GDSL esterase/lipase 1-like [Carica papaya]|uniref:GDSL esterase/lipase 1-like n=1 Tax=Carica papaya TaxID=3649 RepID=UPI000B8C77A6|nr:GDSL esterase/lipase 1-like [Carica papaya]
MKKSHLFLWVLVSRLVMSSISLQLQTNQAALYVFGDSFFDAGTNNYINTLTYFKANYWPYGQTTFNSLTGRFSNGRLIPDFISEYAWLPVIPPYLQPGNQQFFSYGVNFASGGGGVLPQTYSGYVHIHLLH